MDFADTISIFPLPNVVLFPQVELPLHIFEPRYREMVTDAMDGDHLIGMVLLRAGWREAAGGPPAIYPIGCVGRIEKYDLVEDGRSNLVLHGQRRFEVKEELEGKPYRRARVEWAPMPSTDNDERVRDRLRTCVIGLLERAGKTGPGEIWDRLPKEWTKLVNLLAFGLPLKEVEKMALLECTGCAARAERMIEILEFRLAEHQSRNSSGSSGSGESWH
ncbi:MAG: LON peptidase substrate-binding domain-containing protein [Candidatus Binatia bacterium]|nr:LON peptidase substrate-binding domain-containing protein [Candidatus Binatia bacterium]